MIVEIRMHSEEEDEMNGSQLPRDNLILQVIECISIAIIRVISNSLAMIIVIVGETKQFHSLLVTWYGYLIPIRH